MRAMGRGDAACSEISLSDEGASSDGLDTTGCRRILKVDPFFGEGQGGESEKYSGDSELHVGAIK